jgi:hypothetical protein
MGDSSLRPKKAKNQKITDSIFSKASTFDVNYDYSHRKRDKYSHCPEIF